MSGITSSAELKPSTKLRIEELTFHWDVNMSSLVNKRGKGQPIKSPVFTLGNSTKYSWQLQFVSLGPYNNSLSLQLLSVDKPDSSKHSEIQACAFASYTKSPQELRGFTRGDHQYEKLRSGSTFQMIIKLDDFYEAARKPYVRSVISFQCIIFIELGIEQPCVSRSTINGSDSVVKSLQSLLNSGDFSDVQLITATKQFFVHKVVLAARSPVFAAMFRSSMREAKQNSVKISDFNENIVNSMIEFMYSGKTELSTNILFCPDLLRISDKYELLDLKSEVENVLQLSVNAENAVELLILAHLHNCDALKITAINFVNGNKKQLSETEAFKKLGAGSHPEILKELFLSMNKKTMTETESFKTLAKTHPEMLMELYLAN